MPTINHDFLIQAIQGSTVSVFSMMLDAEATPGPASTVEEEMEGGLVSLVGLTGSWSGTGSICCTPAVAGRLYARLLGMDTPPETETVTDEIMDATAELANMIVGNIKNILEERIGPMSMNTPMVVYGRNFKFKQAGGMTGISIPFKWDGDRIDVRLFLAESAEKNPAAALKSGSMVLHCA